jgi:hypothetical protein
MLDRKYPCSAATRILVHHPCIPTRQRKHNIDDPRGLRVPPCCIMCICLMREKIILVRLSMLFLHCFSMNEWLAAPTSRVGGVHCVAEAPRANCVNSYLGNQVIFCG